MREEPLVNVTIPTYNRAATCLGRAIDAALRQTYHRTTVTVIDDGSTDDTAALVRSYASEPRFACVRLAENVGTAQAKNVSILCSRYDAITFHDSDDVPSDHKVLLQQRALCLQGHRADHILDWRAVGHEPGCDLPVDVVVGGYDLLKMDGSVHYINKRISLVDDFFPNLQFPSRVEGDWCLINAGLFRRGVFEALGGYLDSIEEDRELRNRTIAAGCVYYFVDRALLTKIEMSDSLTIEQDTGYEGHLRRRDRDEVWRRNQLYRSGVLGARVAHEAGVVMDLSDVVIEEVINPDNLTYNLAIPATAGSRQTLGALAGPAPLQMAAGE
jgi:glycosyltransferase involved in cell wall biosynthesis